MIPFLKTGIMNKLFLLLIFTISIHFAHAQVTEKNKQQSEMQQAVEDMKKEISDLEAEIKDKEKTDRTEAEALKNQLAALKNMLNMIDKTCKPATQPTTYKAPKSLTPNATPSPIVSVSLKQALPIPTMAQSNDRLLWYRGKKYNDTTLVIVRGMIVQFNKNKYIVVLQPRKKTDPLDKIVQEFIKGEQRKTELIDKFDKMENGFIYFPELKNGLAMIDDITERFKSVLKNTVELPVLPMPGSVLNNPSSGKSGRGPNADSHSYDNFIRESEDEQNVKEMEERWERELALAKKQFKELPPASEFPAPPMREYGTCTLCDTSLLRKQKIQDSIWFDNYWGKERKIFQRILGIERQKALLNGTGRDISSFMDSIFEREAAKNNILYEKYGNDIRNKNIVSEAILGYERQRQLLGASQGSATDNNGPIEKYFKMIIRYYS